MIKTIKEQIDEAMKFSIDSSKNDTVDWRLAPPGWQYLVQLCNQAVDLLVGRIESVRYYNGLLKVDMRADEPGRQQLLTWISREVEKASATQCMIAPNVRGKRRKEYPGSPCLSSKVYIEYLNSLPEEAHV